MAIYKAKQGFYKEVKPMEIILPDGFELITGGDNDIGHGKYNGLFHWLGCTTKEYFEANKELFKGYHMEFNDFGPLVFVSIHDTQFDEEYPYIITSEEFNKKWEFSKYRVAEFSEDFRLKNMVRILFIETEFKINALEVTNRDYFDFHDFKKMEIHDDYELSSILKERHSSIHVSDNDICLAYWNELIHNIVSPYGASIDHKGVNINAAHEAFSSVAENSEEDHLYNLIMNHEKWVAACDKSKKLMDFEEITLIS